MYRILASSLLIFALAACGTPEPPVGPLGVVTVSPAASTEDVAPEATVNVTFDRAIEATTLEDRFTVALDGEPVAGAVSYIRATRTARFTPEEPFAEGAHTVLLASGIRGEDGSRLTSDQSWSFTVVENAEGDPGPTPGPGDPNHDPDPPDPSDPTDPSDPVEAQAPRAAFLSPTPNKRTAGLVNVEIDLEAPAGILRAELFVEGAGGSNRVARLDTDPDDDPIERETLTAAISTVDFETGIYVLRLELEDLAGNVIERSLAIEFLTPFLVTTPTYGESVGAGRQIVAVTIGVNGTIRDDYDVTGLDLFINGELYAAGIPIEEASTTRLAVYGWDTAVDGPGHPADASGDRMLTVRVTFVEPTTDESRVEFTPGVLVNYQFEAPDEEEEL